MGLEGGGDERTITLRASKRLELPGSSSSKASRGIAPTISRAGERGPGSRRLVAVPARLRAATERSWQPKRSLYDTSGRAGGAVVH